MVHTCNSLNPHWYNKLHFHIYNQPTNDSSQHGVAYRVPSNHNHIVSNDSQEV